jgi:hypothetical protein
VIWWLNYSAKGANIVLSLVAPFSGDVGRGSAGEAVAQLVRMWPNGAVVL